MSEIFLSRCFLSRFLALSDINKDEAIDDETSEDVNDDEIIKTLCNRRTRVR